MTDQAQLAALRQRAEAAQKAFRETLQDYKEASGEPPLFLLERPAETLRANGLTGARVFETRHVMIKALARGRIGAEIGVQHGHFSRFLLDTLEISELHLFDLLGDIIRDDVKTAKEVRLHLGDSSTQLLALPDACLDWAYIDGDHSYAGALKDAEAALEKVKPGGTLFFNDYTPWSPGEVMPYGVMAVVNDLVNAGHDMIGVALTANGYFDVALRR